MTAYPAGVPCWVETLQPDPHAAVRFYGGVFGWDAQGPGRTPSGGDYFVARKDGDDVAGITALPPGVPAEPAWTTYVRVAHVEDVLERAMRAGGRIVAGPLDAPPAGRLAIVEDPGGATFGLWEAHARDGAQRVNAPDAWAMSALRTPDLDAANAFYAATLGWSAEPFGPSRAVLYRLPGYVGGLPQQPVPRDVVAVGMEVADARPAHWAVDFWTSDVAETVARVERLGGTVLRAPFDEGPFRRAVLADAAGARFSVSELVRSRLG